MNKKKASAILAIGAGLKRNEKSCFDYEIPPDVASVIGRTQVYSRGSLQTQLPSNSHTEADEEEEMDETLDKNF